jgi:hypothetical protein
MINIPEKLPKNARDLRAELLPVQLSSFLPISLLQLQWETKMYRLKVKLFLNVHLATLSNLHWRLKFLVKHF